jgi:hypothetical protein
MSEIDNEAIYGRYDKQEDDKHKLAMKLRHKAVNIPMDDDPLNVTTQTTTASGMDWKHLAVIAATALGAVGLYKFGGSKAQPPIATPVISTPVSAADQKSQFDIIHYQKDADGKLTPITMQRLPDNLRDQIRPAK